MTCNSIRTLLLSAALGGGVLLASLSYAADRDALTAAIPGGYDLILPHPEYMDARVLPHDDRSLTVSVRSKAGREPMSLRLTFFKNPRGKAPSQQQSAAMVARMAEPYLTGSVEGRIGLWEIDTLLGPATLSTLTQRQSVGSAVPAGEFSTITVGQIATDDVAVAITLLTNGMDNEVFKQTLGVIAALAVLPNNEALAKLPLPPTGYQWEACPEIKGALLRPDGWYFKKRITGDSLAYFISKEDLDIVEEFTTGLSVFALVDHGDENNIRASDFAKKYVQNATKSSHVRKAPWTKTMGPFVSHGVIITTPDIEKGDFVSHMLAIANEETSTVYIVVFESPVEDWAKMKVLSKPILEMLFIDSEI